MSGWFSCEAVERDPNKVSGAWVFRGTRVPVEALFENLEDGAQIKEFVAWFPGVSIEQVRLVRILVIPIICSGFIRSSMYPDALNG